MADSSAIPDVLAEVGPRLRRLRERRGVTLTALARPPKPATLFLFLFLCGASHGVFDAMTRGGGGIAFFAPFDNTRRSFPWHPILVSPLGVDGFATHHLPLDQGPDAYAKFQKKEDGYIKVLLQP